MGPFVRLGDGAILTVEGTDAFFSRDEGKTWSERRPVFVNAGTARLVVESVEPSH